MRRATQMSCMLATGVLLGACRSPPPPKPAPPPPPPVKVSIVVSADVNPDAQNRPSPIVLRVYQLKDDAAFKDADIFALLEREQATLGASLVSRAEFELAPAERRALDVELSRDARFVAVIAAYRDIRNAEWRAQFGAADKEIHALIKNNSIGIAVDRARVSFAAR